MRMRHKKWTGPELKASAFCVDCPACRRGEWRQGYPRADRPFMVELGCGKGAFISRAARLSPGVNFLGIDKIGNMLGVAKRTVEREFSGEPVGNVLLAAWDIERIGGLLAPEDRVDGLFIYFCNPWPKERHKKHRLTHTRQLLLYREFLAPDARLYFKTDDDGLFDDTHGYLREAGFEIEYATRDLHAAGVTGNIETEHEAWFSAQGVPIKALTARVAGAMRMIMEE